VPPRDPRHDLTVALVLAVIAFLAFGVLVAMILTDTFALDDTAVAWVGTGLIGIGAGVLAGWVVVLNLETDMDWAERVGGDLLLAGLGFGFILAGLPTFAAGVI
jgi:hypothetical protein